MRRFMSVGVAAIGLLLFAMPSFSQEVTIPKAEVFGGFSLASVPGVTSLDPTTGLPTSARKSFMGWQTSADFNVTNHLGIVGDFGGQYASVSGFNILGVNVPGYSVNSYQFLFGPQIAFYRPRVTPYVHALFGGIRDGVGSISVLGITTPAVSSTGFGMGFGGGFDVNLSERLALRVPQFDWTLKHIAGASVAGISVPGAWSTGEIRIGIGLVFKAGSK